MKKKFFFTLNEINKKVLPKLSGKDPLKMNKFQKAILAYRYYVLINSLD
ncbi:hypothetical protein HNQ03_001462 [Chryseobacterium sp. 16F]|uniref:SsrA-binding protein n=1 Tax=Frigoriflavimonas asaccharolytica TaxID=2735899 RepID=A0A8J8G6Y5_9FLAO|nr:hypothetical protein [Frigoriflavimonas asaccharolytica]